MKRRILSVLAAVALGLSALGVAAPAAAEKPEGAAYVALGDSVAAGTGNLPYVQTSDPPYVDLMCPHSDGTTKPALRSMNDAYPVILAEWLGKPVVSEACAEYDTAEVALYQFGDLGPKTKLVTLTVGVNDVQWPEVPGFPLDAAPDWGDALGACSNFGTPAACAALVKLSLDVLAPLPQRIEELIDAIRALAPKAKIYVTGYAPLFGDVSGTCSVGQGLSYDAAQTRVINQAVLDVNALIATGVSVAGDRKATYVDVVEQFDGHGLCDTGESWIGAPTAPEDPARDRAFHPTAAGQLAYATSIAEAIEG